MKEADAKRLRDAWSQRVAKPFRAVWKVGRETAWFAEVAQFPAVAAEVAAFLDGDEKAKFVAFLGDGGTKPQTDYRSGTSFDEAFRDVAEEAFLEQRELADLERFLRIAAQIESGARGQRAAHEHRFLRHKKKPEWGVGIALTDFDGGQVDVLFQHSGRKRLKADFPGLVWLAPDEIPSEQRQTLLAASLPSPVAAAEGPIPDEETAVLVRLYGYSIRKSLEREYGDRDELSIEEHEELRQYSKRISRLNRDIATAVGLKPDAASSAKLGKVRSLYSTVPFRALVQELAARVAAHSEAAQSTRLRFFEDADEVGSFLEAHETQVAGWDDLDVLCQEASQSHAILFEKSWDR